MHKQTKRGEQKKRKQFVFQVRKIHTLKHKEDDALPVQTLSALIDEIFQR